MNFGVNRNYDLISTLLQCKMTFICVRTQTQKKNTTEKKTDANIIHNTHKLPLVTLSLSVTD